MSKHLTVKNAIIILLILVLLYMQFCNRTVVERPVIQPAKEKIVEKNLQDAQRKHIYDSFDIVLKKDYAEDYKNEGYLINLLNENSRLVKINDNLQNISFPDTCKPVVTLLNNRYKEYVTQTGKTLTQAQQSISGLNQTISNQKKFLDTKDSEMKKVIILRDSCISDYSKLEKYSNKISPKRELIIGASGLTRYDLLNKIDVGIVLGYRTKNGTTLTAGVYTNKQVTLTISKSLVRF